ncbi:MAG: recombination mediator RecR [Chloroflexi bacterium]|nr:recombination mediator RecR [Chloroflexota bacterium]
MNSDFLPAAAPVADLIEEFHKLPGIGSKSAQRLTYYLVRMPQEEARKLAETILAVKERIIFCSQCQNISEVDPCPICTNPERDRSMICVLEEPLDVLALERTRCYKGLYHVLHGAISPMNGIGPEELRLRELLDRLKDGSVQEVVLATNPNLEGEATAMYIHRLISPLIPKVTRLARGLPVGGDLEYADEVTLTRAFQGRQEF